MAKKRSASLADDPSNDEINEVEEVDMSLDESDDEPNESLPPSDPTDGEEVSFLDTFYGLASASPMERAKSAHAMLQHCLLGPSANTKDAAYALGRLLKGLCSGRAAARQGYASALTSFLKISYKNEMLHKMQKEVMSEEENDESKGGKSVWMFVLRQLRRATDPSQAESSKFGKAKGSEERDYQFGHLFGILSIVRSGILTPNTELELTEVEQANGGLVNDLIALYHHKKWMREPAAHGIITLMNSLYDSENSDQAMDVIYVLSKEVIVPKLFAEKGLDSLTAEQIAVALSIQSHLHPYPRDLPSPLCDSVVSPKSVPILAEALSATSSVVHPRTHVVWDTLWLYLTTVEDADRDQLRTLRASCPITNERASDVVRALMKSLVIEGLLAVGSDGLQAQGNNPTHERRALALSLVKILCGGRFSSSSIAPFTVAVDLELLDDVILSSAVTKRLFLDVICAGGKGNKNAHMLKPLALHVLEAIMESETFDSSYPDCYDRRLSFAKSLLRCEPRFDGRSKTATISDMLLLNDTKEFSYNRNVGEMWTKYIDFLEDQTMFAPADTDDVDMEADVENDQGPAIPTYDSLGYVDVLFTFAKRIQRIQAIGDSASDFEKFKMSAVKRILGFFMSSAFFDCSNLVDSNEKKRKKKKKAKKESFDGLEMDAVVAAGLRVKECFSCHSDKAYPIPYELRATLSSRFFSLLADFLAVKPTANPEGAPDDQKFHKDEKVLNVLSDLVNGWALLEEGGAQRLASLDGDDTESNQEIKSGFSNVVKMNEMASRLVKQYRSTDDVALLAKMRCASGAAILASTLCLHFLRCGTSEDIIDDIDDEDGDDDDEILEMINHMLEVRDSLFGALSSEHKECDDEKKSPDFGLAELCAQVLSSPLASGSQSRGASPTLLRESVKFAWIGGLGIYAVSADGVSLDDDTLGLLLGAIGASAMEKDEEADHDDSESDSADESTDSDNDENKAVFSQTAGKALGLDEDGPDVAMENNDESKSAEEEEDVELDPVQLESLLLEDSDVILDDDGDEGELEHHEGADAALARLIKLKQDARKAGRQALERLETARRLRCVMLMDVLLSNPGRQWSNLLQRSVFERMVLPLLQSGRELEKALEKSRTQLGKKSAAADSEKRALLERLTSLTKTKLCKVRWSKESELEDRAAAEIACEIMEQARRSSSKEHSSCCSAALLAAVRNTAVVGEMVKISNVYGEALVEWSTKRTTKLQTSLFDDLVHRFPSLAQIALVVPLSTAAREARSPFLKSEAFKTLAILYRRSPGNGEDSELETRGLEGLKQGSGSVVECVSFALKDVDMLKTKRVKDVLKTAESIIGFLQGQPDVTLSKQLQEMKSSMEVVKGDTESSGVRDVCEKLAHEIDECLSRMEPVNESANEENSSKLFSGKKKKKKKSKNK